MELPLSPRMTNLFYFIWFVPENRFFLTFLGILGNTPIQQLILDCKNKLDGLLLHGNDEVYAMNLKINTIKSSLDLIWCGFDFFPPLLIFHWQLPLLNF